MSIETDLSDIAPMIITGIACRLVSPARRTIQQVTPQVFCFCEYECEYEERVFALGGGTDFQNDKSSFAFRRSVDSDTFDFELWKDGVKIEDLIDNTFGEFFDFGDFPTQPDVKAFRIHWSNVFSTHGSGRYQFKASFTVTGVSDTFESRFFRLEKFDLRIATGTVRIETVQNGCIIGGRSEFDYTGMNWESMIRIPADVNGEDWELLNENYVDSNRNKQEIQSTIITKYQIQTKLLPKSVRDILIYNNMIANQIFMTDYNIFSQHIDTKGKELVYKRIELFPDTIGTPNYFKMSQKGIFILNFTDKAETPLKRNFK